LLVNRRHLAPWTFFLAVAFALVPLSVTRLGGQAPAQPRPGVIALRGGTLVTVTGGTIPNGTIVLRDGKIAALGANVTIPSGAEVIDVTGKFISPGIIDAHSHIAADAINEGGTVVSSMVSIKDVLDPTDINIYRDLAGGLTVANVLHGSANPIGGGNAVIKLRWGKKRGEDLLFEGALTGIKFALGENPKRQGNPTQPNQAPRYPATRGGVEYVIRDAFTRAKAYQKSWQEYEKTKAVNKDALPPRRDLQLDPLVEVLEGKRLVHAHCYRADEILMLIRLAEEMGFKISTFQHVLEGYKVAKEIAAHGAGASTFSDWWGYKIEAEDAIPYNAALMHQKGVLVSINSDSAEHARRLNTEAAKTIKWGGLTPDEAFAMVTINPAKQLRIDNKVGSLEVGKDADVVVWSAHPLSSFAVADRVYIDGILYHDREADARRITELEKEKAALRGTSTAPGGGGQEQPDSFEQWMTLLEADVERFSGGPRVGHDPADSLPRRSATREGGAQTPQVPTPPGSPGPNDVIAITNARIVPVTKGTIERGTIIIRGNKIAEVGANVPVPAGAKVIDAKGGSVYPGFIETSTDLGLNEPGVRGMDDVTEMLDFNQNIRTRVEYQADSDAIPIARVNGVTTAAVMPSGGILSGDVAVMNLDGWTWEEATVKPSAGIVFSFPAVAGGGGRGGGGGGGRGGGAPGGETSYDELKRRRDQRLEQVSSYFARARAYAKAGANRQTDWMLEGLVPVVEKRGKLYTRVGSYMDFADAIAFGAKENVDMVIITSPFAAAMGVKALAGKNVPIILTEVQSMPQSDDVSHNYNYAAGDVLQKAGVKFSFSTGGYDSARNLPYQAAQSVAWGLSKDDAIKALTINAAEILGVGASVGSLEEGKIANLFIVDGDPLELTTNVKNVIVNGRDVGLENKHWLLWQRFMGRK
jgi:imidazolonepropionase-like amidohydrolase